MKIPSELKRFPKAFAEICARINFLLKLAGMINNMEGRNGIRVIITENNIILENDPDGGDASGAGGTPGGLPPGYGPIQVTACVDGSEETIIVLGRR